MQPSASHRQPPYTHKHAKPTPAPTAGTASSQSEQQPHLTSRHFSVFSTNLKYWVFLFGWFFTLLKPYYVLHTISRAHGTGTSPPACPAPQLSPKDRAAHPSQGTTASAPLGTESPSCPGLPLRNPCLGECRGQLQTWGGDWGDVQRTRNSLLRFSTCYHPVKELSDPANSKCVLGYERRNAQDGREIAFPRERGKGRQSRSPRRTLSLRASLFGCPQGTQNEEKSTFTYK